jgi:hypothetical protein
LTVWQLYIFYLTDNIYNGLGYVNYLALLKVILDLFYF